MARGLFEMGVWLHPDESKALFEALDEDDGGTVDSQEFCAFWEKYGTCLGNCVSLFVFVM
jgi:hypothetical protein